MWTAGVTALAYLGALAWIVIVVIMALKGNDMERSDRVAQLYGYSVCLIAVVVVLMSISSLIDNLFKVSNPLAAPEFPSYGPQASLRSFEAYKATANPASDDAGAPALAKVRHTHPSEAVLRTQYEALRADRLASVRFAALRSITSSLVLLILAAVLFVFHWRWLRQRAVTL